MKWMALHVIAVELLLGIVGAFAARDNRVLEDTAYFMLFGLAGGFVMLFFATVVGKAVAVVASRSSRLTAWLLTVGFLLAVTVVGTSFGAFVWWDMATEPGSNPFLGRTLAYSRNILDPGIALLGAMLGIIPSILIGTAAQRQFLAYGSALRMRT